jgi:hypothetical protein
MEQRRGPDTYCDDLNASFKRLNEEARTLRERKRDEMSK